MRYSFAALTGPVGRRLMVGAAAVLLIGAVVATYSMLAPRDNADRSAGQAAPSPPVAVAQATGPEQPLPLPPATRESDPETFAQGVAEALFAWDTSTAATPDAVTTLLAGVADPTGESSAGLVADIAGYLPSPAAWAELRRYETRQWLEVTSVEVPNLWATAVEQAGPDGLLPGTAAYTIRGVRHRAGLWEGEPVSSAHEVAFTVFIVCEPSYRACHLLRLSRLDDPLE